MFADKDAPIFQEIELMKELVLEFGDAISNRIKEIDAGHVLKAEQPGTTPRLNVTPRGGP